MPKKTKLPKIKPMGCAACPNVAQKEQDCFYSEVEANFPNKPTLIVIEGQAEPNELHLPSHFCNIPPTSKILKACREQYLEPILAQHPHLPILACGVQAVKALWGGNVGRGMLSKVRQWKTHKVYGAYDLDELEDNPVDAKLRFDVFKRSAMAFPWEISWEIVTPDTVLPDAELLRAKEWYIDLECSGLKGPWHGTSISVIGLSTSLDSKVWIFPAHNAYAQDTSQQFAAIAHEYTGTLVGHGFSFDLHFLHYYGLIKERMQCFDTIILSRADAVQHKGRSGLKWLAKEHFGFFGYEAEAHTLWDEGFNCGEIDIHLVGEYCARDVDVTRRLYEEWLCQTDI